MKILAQILCLFLSTISCFGQNSNFVETQEGVLHYEVIGEGKPILIINGGPGFSSEGFRNIAKDIASLGYKSILFDQRGTGKSSLNKVDSTTVTIDKMALDMELIREDIGVERWILYGHSFGGMLANYYASIYPKKVLAMIHSSSGGLDLHLLEEAQDNLYARLTEQEIDSLQYWRSRLADYNNEENRFRFNTVLSSAYVYHKKHIPTVSNRLMQGNLTLNRMVWNDLITNNFDCKQDLQSFDAPVLIIQGKQDVIPDTLAHIANSVFPNSTLHFLDKCGHYGWLDQKELYLDYISLFLKDIEKNDIEELINRYVSAIYNRDSTLIYQITDSTLQKSGHFWSRKSAKWKYEDMNFEQLIHTANTYNQKDWIPKWAPNELEIFEIKERVAVAKVKAIWGFDYLFLSKDSLGKWRIDKILWQSYTESEAKEFFSDLKNPLK